ncbi:hypothetical protein [Coxiella-like endosymbiont of Rhipicephalus sanguineus]|nr:hypothetical protein [Coxiella-like endosymbiont of Rhipicephalus sanguineus]
MNIAYEKTKKLWTKNRAESSSTELSPVAEMKSFEKEVAGPVTH